MKRIFTLLILTAVSYVSNAQRLVFVEEFTQASCPPCETSTPQLNATLSANADKVVQLRYQTSWPGVDPMNADNPDEVQTRVDYYGITGVPGVRIDGQNAVGATFPELITPANIAANYAIESPLSIALSHTLSDNLQEATIVATITNTSDAMYDIATDKIRVAGVEELIAWPFRPGSTSIQDYEYVMKKFYTGVEGMDVPALAAGESIEMTWTENLANVIYNVEEFNVVAFIQDDATKSIVNAAESTKVAIDKSTYADAGTVDVTVAPGDYCQESVTPTITITNDGEANITQATIAAFNGVTAQAYEWTGDLATGESADFDLGAFPLDNGANPLGLYLLSVNNGQRDLVYFNNIPTPGQYNKFSDLAVVDEDFEGRAFGDVGDFIVDAPIALAFVTVTPAEFNTNVGSESANSVSRGWSTTTVDTSPSSYSARRGARRWRPLADSRRGR